LLPQQSLWRKPLPLMTEVDRDSIMMGEKSNYKITVDATAQDLVVFQSSKP
jgi:hypothetical protein